MSEPVPAPSRSGNAPAVTISTERLVSIALPVYNQADHIDEIVEQYETVLAALPCPHETILATNNCRDRSVEVCQKLAEKYPSVRTVNSDKGGWGLAVKLGLAHAKGDLLSYTNSARTTAAELHDLITCALRNPDYAIKAHRMSRESMDRKIGSLFYNVECRLLFKIPAWDINATPKVFSRKVYEALNLESDGDLIDLEFYVKCARLCIPVMEMPVYSMARHGGKSTTNFRSAWRMYSGALRLWRDHQRQEGVFSNWPRQTS